ncbi:MAG: DUF2252 family protein [Bacteroidia bacterium]|nr:DUF2252 family protein [Bacteroidia bacterium]
MAADDNGFKKKKRNQIVQAFVQAYVDGLTEFASDDREKWHEYRLDNSPEIIRNLLERSQKSRADFLNDLIDTEKERFFPSKKIVPCSGHIAKFQEIVNVYCQENEIDREGRVADFFEVKDVAVKKGSGTASLGLDRYFVLISGPSDDPLDDIILELKQARESALSGLVPKPEDGHKLGEVSKAAQIVEAHRVHLAGGDPYYGHVHFDDKSYLVRERSPFKEEIELDELDLSEFIEYASICGKTLAQTHARSDEDTGIMEGNAEEKILEAIQRPVLFVDDILRFAQVAAKRIKRDYRLFKADHQLGAFEFMGQDNG